MYPEVEIQPQLTRVLIVEDDPLQQEVLKSALTLQGYEIEMASDGLGALNRVRESKYDLVLVDYDLPEINGLAMARLVHDLMGEVVRPVLIALTGSPDRLASKEAVPGIAFDEIISKPCDLEELGSRMRRHLDARSGTATRREAESTLFLDNWADYDAAAEPDGNQDGQSARPCVLVVEDDELQQLVLKSALEAFGCGVQIASNGLQAVRMIREGRFDLALVDYQMPEMDGLATGRVILDLLSEDIRPRMIAFTSAPDHLIGRLVKTGSAFDEIIAKSAGLPALFVAVERHLRSSPRGATRRAAAATFLSAA